MHGFCSICSYQKSGYKIMQVSDLGVRDQIVISPIHRVCLERLRYWSGPLMETPGQVSVDFFIFCNLV